MTVVHARVGKTRLPPCDVAMVVRNAFVGDTRVEKEAALLASEGLRVLVIAVGAPGLPESDRKRGFDVLRIDVDPLGIGPYLQRTGEAIPYPEDHAVPAHVQLLYYGRAAAGHAHALGRRAMFHGLVVEALLRARPRVIHCHDLNTLLPGFIAGRLLAARVVYDSHELWQHRNRLIPRSLVTQVEEETLERQLIGRVDRVITVSETIAEHLAGTYGIDVPVVLLNVPEEREPQREGNLRGRIGRNGPILLYLGGIVVGRGLEQAVRGMAHLPDANLVLMGKPNRDYVRFLEELGHSLGVGDRVFVLPPVPSDEVLDWAAGADVGLCTIEPRCLSYELCLPNKLFQCAFAGVPVLATDLPEMRRWFSAYALGELCQPYDPADFARGVSALLDGSTAVMGEDERLRFRERWSWQAEGRKLRAVYEELGVLGAT